MNKLEFIELLEYIEQNHAIIDGFHVKYLGCQYDFRTQSFFRFDIDQWGVHYLFLILDNNYHVLKNGAVIHSTPREEIGFKDFIVAFLNGGEK